jgi:protein Mpv17
MRFIAARQSSSNFGFGRQFNSNSGKRGAKEFVKHSKISSSSAMSSMSNSSTINAGTNIGKMNPLLKSALTSACLGIVGDFVAQSLAKKPFWEQKSSALADDVAGVAKKKNHAKNHAKKEANATKDSTATTTTQYDYQRTGRQSLFNFVFYGPLQHHWYIFLAKRFPTVPASFAKANLAPFATKVFLNQAVLGPVVVASFFAWSQAFTTGFTLDKWSEKVARDSIPTLKKGWAFWVPASAINFSFVPVHKQVLYMSCCSIVWNCILSQAGNKDPVVVAVDDLKKKKKR